MPKSKKTAAVEGAVINDAFYNLVNFIYHASKGAVLYERFRADAERDGDDELVSFFEEIKDEEARRVEHARSLLAEELRDEEEATENEDIENAAE